MSAVPGDAKNDTITVEINGVAYPARRGDMLIEVTDAAGITVPRFCYHKKLSIAANCRMCLVEVEKVPKPLPACATPVNDGMKVFTHSPKALEAQKGTMEFLLINHPLDCPICDEGGECELQETSLGFGADFSRFDLPKRVVRDEDIGPLIATEMTRCIHCTRCVRFGTEIAGIRELGATGRGEHMRIGTYIGTTVTSEMSGNVIDLCPVGALTSKPFRFKARAWELARRSTVSPHDCIGSNLYARTRGSRVMRMDPRENEQINECWIPDRDRFSYEALGGSERLLRPMVKRDGTWHEVDWSTALETAVKGLRSAIGDDPSALGALVSSSATVEEMYLLQRLVRDLGGSNVDHRLRQTDFRDDERAPRFPWLGRTLDELGQSDAVLLVGSYARKDQPILAHRLRQASLRAAAVMFVNPVAYEFNFAVAENVAAGARLTHAVAAVARALLENRGAAAPAGYEALLAGVTVDDEARRIAGRLAAARRPAILLGDIAAAHPEYSTLRALVGLISRLLGIETGYLTPGANSAGAWLVGAVPHRGPGGENAAARGLDAGAMFERDLRAYLLFGVEPEFDAADPARARAALQAAGCVVAMTAFRSEAMLDYADVLLPVSPFTETAGTWVNVEGRWQSFEGVVPPAGEARPGWKVLRVLANLLNVSGFEYMSVEDIREELRHEIGEPGPSGEAEWSAPKSLGDSAGQALIRVGHVPIHAADGIVRRAPALQRTVDALEAPRVLVGNELAMRLGLRDGARARITQGDGAAELTVAVDDGVPAGCVLVPAGLAETASLGRLFGAVTVTAVEGAR
ncbi:MAG: NADH-quinone oxidoreductase subunit NuoG [Gammaproteobacteria bacterium]|jgi:NADH-quinone oxidoreductase subunit G|nr:NADH-quinone oxidoreductase subunit NuoG [Gammaproteobacteria bacterium]